MLVGETPRLAIRPFVHNDAKAMEGIFCDPEVIDHSIELFAPPGTQLCQDLAFEWNRFAHDDIEGTDAVRRHQKEPVGVNNVDVTHLALADPVEGELARLHRRHLQWSSLLTAIDRGPSVPLHSASGWTRVARRNREKVKPFPEMSVGLVQT